MHNTTWHRPASACVFHCRQSFKTFKQMIFNECLNSSETLSEPASFIFVAILRSASQRDDYCWSTERRRILVGNCRKVASGEEAIFFTEVQTPVTLCSGELWSILVVRLAHSADLRSRLRHVSSAPCVAYSMDFRYRFPNLDSIADPIKSIVVRKN